MKTFKTTINRYNVELSLHSGEERSECFVAYKNYSSSLSALSDTGVLSDGGVEEHAVPHNIIEMIEEWALALGY